MGIPGVSSDQEMNTVASTDNHSPASADPVQKQQQHKANGHSEDNSGSNNSMTNSVGGAKTPTRSNSGGGGGSSSAPNAAADMSSEGADVDVTTMENTTSDEPAASSRLAAKLGMTDKALLKGRLKLIRTHVVAALFKHPKSQPFREPVNAKALGIYPLYHQVIKTPMDLGTVRKKIDRGDYATRDACLADIELVWNNAKTFNKPGHFVYEAAKLLCDVCNDKLARLERDEAAGLYNDILQSAGKPRVPKPKPTPRAAVSRLLGEPAAASASATTPEPPREVRKRPVRKVSLDMPGEHSQPQHLKKKYVENLSEQMKQCDAILRELMTTKPQKSNCEPFLRISANVYGTKFEPIDLYHIQSRLQTSFYRHPLHFASDFRRMITEAYRYTPDNGPVHAKAADLHHAFEFRFSRVDFEPVENPSIFDAGAMDDESMVYQLASAQDKLISIQINVGRLIKDLVIIRQQERGTKKRKTAAPSGGRRQPTPGGSTSSALAAPPKRKRGRPPRGSTPASSKATPTAAKRARTASGGRRKSETGAAAAAVSIDESLELRDLVGTLTEEQQQRIVQIMMDNNETLTTDANGFTEIDLGNCTAKTVSDVQSYIKSAKAAAAKTKPAAKRKSPAAAARQRKKSGSSPRKAAAAKKGQQRNGSLSDSSSESDSDGDEEDESSSGSSSSSDESDSD